MMNVNLQHPAKVLMSGYYDSKKAFDDLQEVIESSSIKNLTPEQKKNALSEFKKLDSAFKLLQEARERFEGLRREFDERTQAVD
jgi:translation initiation factor 2 alpha subunit (eIF-2alpha)